MFAAAEVGAIAVLLLTDALFRTNSVPKRRKFAQLVQDVESSGESTGCVCVCERDGTAASSVMGLLCLPIPPFLPALLLSRAGGEVHVFSSGHASGEQLAQLSGIAAVLRFPMPELEDAEVEPPPELR